MNVCYRVELSQAERDQLTALLTGGVHAARKLKRAQIVLAADAGVSDRDIAASITVGGSTVYRTKRRFVEGNLEAALREAPRPGADRKLTGNEEALLIATACSSTPTSPARPSAGAWPRTISSPGRRTCGASPRSTPGTLPAWRMCSTSMPNCLIQSAPWSASMKARPSSS